MNSEAQNSNNEAQADLSRVRQQLRKLRKVLREARALKPASISAVEQLDIEVLKSSGKEKRSAKGKYATAIYRHGQLLALEVRLVTQIFKLKAKIDKLLITGVEIKQ